MIISHEVYKGVSDRFICRPLDIVAVKGKTKRVQIYELVAEKTPSIPDVVVSFHEIFGQGFAAYRDGDRKRALKIFIELEKRNPEDMPVQIYLKRCRHSDMFPQDSSDAVKLDG